MSDEHLHLSPGELADEDDTDISSAYDASEDDAEASLRLPSPTFSSYLTDVERHFPLMSLPPEVRLNVYNCLFADLTINRQRQVTDLTTYHSPHEWPSNDFSAYRNLLLTCKEIYDEAKSLWENMYIRHCCFYFWKVPDLSRVAKLLTNLGEPYRRMSYALRTRTFVETGPRETEFVDNEAEELMLCQPGFPHHDNDYADFHWVWPAFPFGERLGNHALRPNGRIPVNIYRTDGIHPTRVRADFPGLEKCSIAVHDSAGTSRPGHTGYLLMSGTIANVSWAGYDRAAGHAKMQIWEEWRRRGYPAGCLAKSDVVLAWRTKAMSGQDKTWLALGGRPKADLDDLLRFQFSHLLDNWLRID